MGKSPRSKRWANKGDSRRRLKRRLFERDGGRCQFCNVEVQMSQNGDATDPKLFPTMATVEHWPIPRAELDPLEWLWDEHCKLACNRCNNLGSRLGIKLELWKPSVLALKLGEAIDARRTD